MKANELMIGDWYNLSVKEISINRRVDCFFFTEWETHKWMQPIPLTEEILNANGFEHPKYEDGICVEHIIDYNNGGFMRLHIEKEYFYISTQDAYIHLSYVHELQHALRLCGLSELADNFKI